MCSCSSSTSPAEGLPRDVGAASDGCVAITRCLLRGVDRSRNAVGDEDELDCWIRPWSRRSMGDHEVRHCVRCVIPAARILTSPVRASPEHDSAGGFDEFLDHRAAHLRRIEVPVVQANIFTIGSAAKPSIETAMSSRTLANRADPSSLQEREELLARDQRLRRAVVSS